LVVCEQALHAPEKQRSAVLAHVPWLGADAEHGAAVVGEQEAERRTRRRRWR